MTLTEVGTAFAAMQAAGVIARLALGWLGDRTGGASRNLLLQTFASAVMVALFAFIPAQSPPAVFVLASASVGFVATSWQGLALAEVARVSPPEQVAEATAGASTVGFLGFAVGPAASALTVSMSGNWTAALLVVAALLASTGMALAPSLSRVQQ